MSAESDFANAMREVYRRAKVGASYFCASLGRSPAYAFVAPGMQRP